MQLVRPFGQRGETIVEVLIAIAVIGSVIGTSYAIVGRNSRQYQQDDERTIALSIAEAQLEEVRNIVKDPQSPNRSIVTTDNTPFCVNSTGAHQDASQCSLYSRYFTQVYKPAGDTMYIVEVNWQGANSTGGTTDSKVSLRYRL